MPTKETSYQNLTKIPQTESAYSICPSGEKFPLPTEADYDSEFIKVGELVSEQRIKAREIACNLLI
jgi:hypothetical protein